MPRCIADDCDMNHCPTCGGHTYDVRECDECKINAAGERSQRIADKCYGGNYEAMNAAQGW
jgi:Zn finger protein HypA/HybF involved in hydrogenase expression